MTTSTTEKMKERPILFSGEMVRAILDGRKTQTRRPVKPQPSSSDISLCGNVVICGQLENYETGLPAGFGFESDDYQWRCPFGVPGDRLWVRETWGLRLTDNYNGLGQVGDWLEGQQDLLRNDLVPMQPVYRADYNERCKRTAHWRPSIHMPKWASRITLEVELVRVEPLQAISHCDTLAEGVRYDVSQPDGGPISRFKKNMELHLRQTGLRLGRKPLGVGAGI